MYLDPAGNPVREASLYGYRAAAVPGTVKGLDLALEKYGRLGRDKVMAPAIALARDGFMLGAADAAILERGAKRLAADPEAARIFLHPDGSPYRAGERLVQPDLAAILTRIAAEGPDAFYRGAIPHAVAAASAAGGGILSEADFAGYVAGEMPPLACAYRGYRIVSAPPPSSGGTTLCEILNILAGWDLAAAGPGSPRAVHLTAEAMRRAFRDRNSVLGDPDFVANPVARLTSPEYAATLRAAVDPEKATPSAALSAGCRKANGRRRRITRWSTARATRSASPIRSTAISAPR